MFYDFSLPENTNPHLSGGETGPCRTILFPVNAGAFARVIGHPGGRGIGGHPGGRGIDGHPNGLGAGDRGVGDRCNGNGPNPTN